MSRQYAEKATNKKRVTVTNYLPNKKKLTKSNYKQPTSKFPLRGVVFNE